MTRSSPPQLSFSSGEISPLLYGRTDYVRYQTGLRRCPGFLPMRQGGVTRAPGTIWRGRTRNDARARLIDFEFAANDAITLEFTNGFMRVWRYGALVLSGAVPYEIATPFVESDLGNLSWVQSADVIYIVDGRNPIQRLARSALDDWQIGDADVTNGPFRLENLDEAKTIEASGAMGTVDLTGAGAPFEADMVGSLVRLEPENYSDIALWTGNQDVTVGDTVRYGGNIYKLTAGTNTGVNPPIHLSGVEKYDSDDGTSWRFVTDGIGIARITEFVNSGLVRATVLKAIPQPVIDEPTYRWSLGAWSPKYGYPGAIEIYEQRLVAAATPTDPRTVWFSTIGAFDDFEPSIEADGSFAYNIAGQNSVNRILWLRSGRRGLHIGALGEEWSARSTEGDQAIGPTTTEFGLDSSIGSSAVQPIAPDGKPIFISKDARRVFEIAYAFEADANKPVELSLPSEHLGAQGFAEIVWQAAPQRVIWCRRGDGTLVALIYDPEEQVLGWAPYSLAGGAVEAMAVSASADGARDILTLVVRRTVDGEVRRYIEDQSFVFGTASDDPPLASANHLFAALTFTSVAPVDTFAVPHLVGETVRIWSDEGEIGPLVVPDGGALQSPVPVRSAIVGLFDETHSVELLDLAAPARDGSSIGRNKRLNHGSGALLHRTAALKVHATEYHLGRSPVSSRQEELVSRTVGSDLTTAVSGMAQIQAVTGTAREITLTFTPVGAAPATLLSVAPRVEEVGA